MPTAYPPLPMPEHAPCARMCPRCGYDLGEASTLARCPECGLDRPATELVIHGVVRMSSAMPWWKVLAIVALLIVGYIGFEATLMFLTSGTVALVGLMAVVGCVVGLFALFRTSSTGSGGPSRIHVRTGGVALEPLTGAKVIEGSFIELAPAQAVLVEPVSATWSKLKIHSANKVFHAGIQCPREHREQLERAIAQALKGQAPPPEPPVVAHG